MWNEILYKESGANEKSWKQQIYHVPVYMKFLNHFIYYLKKYLSVCIHAIIRVPISNLVIFLPTKFIQQPIFISINQCFIIAHSAVSVHS